MKAGKYNIRELFNNRYVDQIVIPEIQRDYVWTQKEVEGLLQSIREEYLRFSNYELPDLGNQNDAELSHAFEEFYKKQRFSCNIGFIYAYNDAEYAGKYFLIDGQQRLTTIYLILLVLASICKNFRAQFEKLYLFSGSPVVDYRVREASHSFLMSLANEYVDSETIIKDQVWFFDSIADVTIQSIVSNIEVIKNFLNSHNLNQEDFITYMQDHIEFWYFDTNISEQGEELYIYMNARGEQMQENENLKADMLGKILVPNDGLSLADTKNEWGLEWEHWQNFFWLNKRSNDNADKGFNEFINCIAGLENFLADKKIVYSKSEFDQSVRGERNKPAHKDILDVLEKGGLPKIQSYINGLYYIFDKQNIDSFKSHYKDIHWVENFLEEIMTLFNTATTNWFADVKDTDRGIEHSRMVFAWSILLYLGQKRATHFNLEIFRVLRLYYLRFKNYNRAVANIVSDVKNILEVGPWKVTGITEENLKNEWYTQKIHPNDIFEFEEIIWKIEDHPLNLDGRDARAINCSHLIDFSKNPSLQTLKIIKSKFYNLFPIKGDGRVDYSNQKKLASILLSYGAFWERVSPWYCYNYHFANWKKIIRNIDIESRVFDKFFKDYQSTPFEDLFQNKVKVYNIDFGTDEKYQQFKWYAGELKERMWEQGMFIVTEHYSNTKNDKFFKKSPALINTKGDFKGGTPRVLSELVKKQSK